jgi:hypothetical protein
MSDINNPNPYASPAICEDVVVAQIADEADWRAGLYCKGKQLVMHKMARLPDRCVKSNEPVSGERLRRKLSWHHPLVYLALFFGIIGLVIYVILSLVLQKKATIYVGLSEEWFRKRRRAMWIGWTTVLLGLAALAGSIVILVNSKGGTWAGWGIPLGIVMFLGGAIYGLLASRMVAPARITDDYVWLKGVHPEFLADLPPWPYQP